jgi:hypothetical protein
MGLSLKEAVARNLPCLEMTSQSGFLREQRKHHAEAGGSRLLSRRIAPWPYT